MAIHVPGYRSSRKRLSRFGVKKSVVAVLSLTAMVDMFTVLTVFLLQNYNPETGAVLDIPQEIQLPQATSYKKLQPAHVVTISRLGVSVDKKTILTLEQIKANEPLLLPTLKQEIETAIAAKFRQQQDNFGQKLQTAIDVAKSRDPINDQSYKNVTIQADKGIEFSIIKKVMHSASEAGAGEINFAILEKQPDAA